MKDLDKHKKIAVLIDADNAQLSKLKLILDEMSAHGHIISKRAYGDWSNEHLKNWKEALNELAIEPVQQFAYTTGKNATDIAMIIDAMDLLYTKKYDAFALVSSDSDFTRLASRLKQSEIFVFGVGQHKTPISFRNACDDFILTENLGPKPEENTAQEAKESLQQPDKAEQRTTTQAQKTKKVNEQEAKESLQQPDATTQAQKVRPMPIGILNLFMLAWEKYQDDDGWVKLGPAGSFLKRSKPDFDPRTYGVSKMSELILKSSDVFQTKQKKGENGNSQMMYKPKSKPASRRSKPR